jgi:hypothetical protein
MLMGTDAPPDRYEPMKGFSVMISVDDEDQAERIFRALSEVEHADADIEDRLARPFRHARLSVWHTLDGQLRAVRLTIAPPRRLTRTEVDRRHEAGNRLLADYADLR